MPLQIKGRLLDRSFIELLLLMSVSFTALNHHSNSQEIRGGLKIVVLVWDQWRSKVVEDWEILLYLSMIVFLPKRKETRRRIRGKIRRYLLIGKLHC